MDALKKSRLAITILSILLVVSLSALVTVLYHQQREDKLQVQEQNSRRCSSAGMFLQEELGLTETQRAKVEQSCSQCSGSSRCTRDALGQKKNRLIEELSREQSDTARLNLLATDFGATQADVMKIMIRQYLEIKAVCTPDQRQKLSSLYSRMFGCCGSGGDQGRHGKNAPATSDCCNGNGKRGR